MTEKVLRMDLDIDHWTVFEAHAYHRAVGVNAEYALGTVQRAFQTAHAEAVERYGDAVDVKGWEPPDDWVPLAILDIEPTYLLGFCWVSERRDDHDLAFDTMANSVEYGALTRGFWDSATEAVDDAPLVAPNREQRRRKSPQRKTASRSASSTTGPSAKSEA